MRLSARLTGWTFSRVREAVIRPGGLESRSASIRTHPDVCRYDEQSRVVCRGGAALAGLAARGGKLTLNS